MFISCMTSPSAMMFGRICHHFQDTHAARTNHQLEGACIEEVADQNSRRVAEEVVCRFTAAAQIAFIDDIVVQEGGGVDEFHHRCQRVQFFIVMPDCFACQNGNNRTQALTTALMMYVPICEISATSD